NVAFVPAATAVLTTTAATAIAVTATAATATAATTTAATMATPTILSFDAEGRPVQFDAWLDDLHLFLHITAKDDISLYDHASGTAPAPAETAASTARSQWQTRDAHARLAIRSHLQLDERAHFGQHKTAKALYDAVIARYSSPASATIGRLSLPYLFPDLAAFPTVADLITHLRTSDTRYRAALPAEFLAKNPPSMDHFLALCPTELTVDLLEKHLLAAEASIVTVGASRGDPRTPFFDGCSPPPLLPSVASAAAIDYLGAEEVGAASTPSGRRKGGRGKGGKGGGGDSGGGGGGGGGSGGSGGGGGGGGGGGVGGVSGSGGGGGGSGGGGGRGGGGGGGGSGRGGGGWGGGRGGPAQRGGSGGVQRQQQRLGETPSPQQLCEWYSQHGGSGGGGTCPYVIRTGDQAGQTCGRPHTQQRCFSRLDDVWRAQFPDASELPRWADLLKKNIDIFALDFDVILGAMYALTITVEGDCYLRVPPDPGIASSEAAALCASASAAPDPSEATALGAGASGASGDRESAPSGTASTAALHTFTLDSGASRCFFRDCTALAQLPRPVVVSLADPSGGPVLATSTTALPCPAVPSGSLSGLYLPSFSTNLVAGSALQDAGVHQFTPAYERVTHCTCAQTGRHLATFTRQPGSDLYTLTTESPQVAASASESVDDYTRYTTVFPLRTKGEVPDVLIPWIRATRLQLERRFHTDLPVLRLHSDRGGEFSSGLLRAFCQGEGTERTFTLPASPQQNGVAERRIGLVMEVARTSLIHAAAPHFLWPFAVRYAAHQLNLWPRVSVPETSPTLRWTGEVGDASVFRVWGSRAFVRNTSVDKLSSRAVPCVFLGFVPDAPGWQFYHPTSRRVFPSQDVTFDESVPFYRLFPYRTAPLPPPPLFLTPSAASVDPLPPQGPAPSGVSQVDPVKPVEVAVESGPVRGTEPGGTGPGGAEPGGAETRGAEPGGAEPGGAVPGGAEPGGHEPEGTAPGGALSSQQLHEWYSQHCRRRCGAVGAGGATGAGAEGAGATGAGVAADPGVGTRGASATGPGGARTDGTGGVGTGDAARAAGGAGGADARPTGGAGADGAAGAGAPGGTGVGAAGAAGGAAGVGAAAGGAGAVSAGSGGAARPQPYFPASPLPAPSPYTGPSGGLTERRTHRMALRPSTAPLRVPLPSPPESSLPALADPESDSLRAASPTVTRLLATVVTDPSFESTVASALVAELVDFAAHCRLDYAASLVAESESVCPPSVGGECALGTDVLEDRQEDFECFAAAVPHLVSMLIAPEGDPDAPDIPTPRSYAEAI
ncbi:unnamed protein product, partial [Closterium sp. NIES-54]